MRGTGRTLRTNILGVRVNVLAPAVHRPKQSIQGGEEARANIHMRPNEICLHLCTCDVAHIARVIGRAAVQEPRRYHVHLAAETLSGCVPSLPASDPGYQPSSSARTETAPLSINPDFLNKAAVLRLPQSMATSLQPQALLTVQLWAAPSMEHGAIHVCTCL